MQHWWKETTYISFFIWSCAINKLKLEPEQKIISVRIHSNSSVRALDTGILENQFSQIQKLKELYLVFNPNNAALPIPLFGLELSEAVDSPLVVGPPECPLKKVPVSAELLDDPLTLVLASSRSPDAASMGLNKAPRPRGFSACKSKKHTSKFKNQGNVCLKARNDFDSKNVWHTAWRTWSRRHWRD